MRISKTRRDRLFRHGKPTIRPAVYEDLRWFWAAARRDGFTGTQDEFTAQAESLLAEADKIWLVEDKNAQFKEGAGPVGVFLANFDGWSLIPHVEWFPWATPRNKLRCTVGFLQSMRYSNEIGSIKIFAHAEFAPWFKHLKRYLPIIWVGKITGGRPRADEHVFYVRGRRNDRLSIRKTKQQVRAAGVDHPAAAASHS